VDIKEMNVCELDSSGSERWISSGYESPGSIDYG
jgi:hypothetical protein